MLRVFNDRGRRNHNMSRKNFSCLLAVPFSLRKTQPGISIDYSLSILCCIDVVYSNRTFYEI